MEEIELLLTSLIGSYGWMVIAAFATFFFKNGIENMFFGLRFMIGTDFDKDMLINIKGEKCRIVRQGVFKTTFYSLEDNSVFHIPNNKLQNHIIKKELPKT